MSRMLFAALMLCSASAFAQPRIDCSQAKDPKACEERVAKVRASIERARAACEGRTGDERRDCMRRELCAEAKDPARCEARAQKADARRAQISEACKGKAGEELKSCVREQLRSQ